jgi:hypothetical protein
MASAVEICNFALSRIGAPRISALTEKSKAAAECNLLYNIARDAVLSDFPWNFAEKRLVLALLDDSYSGWDYAYQYPTDCLRAREIYNASSDSSKIPFIISSSSTGSRIILTDEDAAELIYTYRATDPNQYDPTFIDSLSFRLASDLALPMNGDARLRSQMLQDYRVSLSGARASNANEKQKEPPQVSAYITARG